jgi:hypothetical protein
MATQRDEDTAANNKYKNERCACGAAGWTTDTELVRVFDRPVNVGNAVISAVDEAIGQWSELAETPPLYNFVDTTRLDGLFKTKATDDSGWLPSAKFQFQSCRVTVLYGSSLRVIIKRDP